MTQDRADLATGFLQRVGWGRAVRQHLAGDASDRRYERLHLGGQSAVLMDAPPGQADDPAAFVLIANHLLNLGLSAPTILAQDLTQGFLLLEDLGDALYARVIADDAQMEEPFYLAATRVLTRLQAAAPPPGMANLSAADGPKPQPWRWTGTGARSRAMRGIVQALCPSCATRLRPSPMVRAS